MPRMHAVTREQFFEKVHLKRESEMNEIGRPEVANDSQPPKGPPAPGDPSGLPPVGPLGDDGTLITLDESLPEWACLLRNGFLDGQQVQQKACTFGYFTINASAGGRIIVEIYGATYKMWFGQDKWAGDLLVETFNLKYTSYNPFRWAPIARFTPRDRGGQPLPSSGIYAGINGACPILHGQVKDCKAVFSDTLDPATIFRLTDNVELRTDRCEFIYC